MGLQIMDETTIVLSNDVEVNYLQDNDAFVWTAVYDNNILFSIIADNGVGEFFPFVLEIFDTIEYYNLDKLTGCMGKRTAEKALNYFARHTATLIKEPIRLTDQEVAWVFSDEAGSQAFYAAIIRETLREMIDRNIFE